MLADAVTEITNLPLSLLEHGDEPREHSVISFLQRPEKIRTVIWSTSQPKLTNLVSLNIPSDTLTTMYREKLRGFGLFRADIVFKLQFNSQPFQAGRLIATYTPVPNYLVGRRIPTRRSLCRLTSMPNVIIDISKQTEVNITLPYISPFTHYDLTSGGGDWGAFDLWVYDPLSSASTQTVNISVRVYYDNIRLGAPTQATLVTAEQMLSASLVRAELQGSDAPAGSFQAILEKNTDSVTIKEERAGPISNIGHDIRQVGVRILNGIGEFIPAISDLTDTANAASMSVLNMFAHFGLGKPTNLDKIAPRCLHAFSNFASLTGIDNGHVLALHGDNKIKMLPGFAGSDTDELSLTYLLQTLQYHDTHTITTANPAGTLVAAHPVSPFKDDVDLQTTMTSAAGDIVFYQPNLQKYIATNFKYWRGDTVLHLGAIKTDYHSLRLKVVYDPMATAPNQVAYNESEYCYSVVIDFRDKTDFYVRLPFISSTPWKNVPFIEYTSVPTPVPSEQQELLSTYCGYVAIFVDNELQASSAVVADQINLICEFCAASNLDLGYPMGGRAYLPIFSTATTPTLTKAELQFNPKSFVADGIMKTRTSMQNSTKDIKSITGLPPRSSNTFVCDYTTGEEVYSLRALIKRFNWVVQANDNHFSLPNTPYAMPIDYTSGQVATFQQCALVDIVSALFAFRNGSFRYKCWDDDSNLFVARCMPEHARTNIINFTAFSLQNLGATAVTEMDAQSVKGAGEFQFPFYSPTYVHINANYIDFVATEPDLYFHFSQPQTLGIVSRSDTSSPAFIAKAAGDDFNLGFLLGVPDCIPEPVAMVIGGRSPVPNMPNPVLRTITAISFS